MSFAGATRMSAPWPDPPSHDVSRDGDAPASADTAPVAALPSALLRLPLDESRLQTLLARTAQGDSRAFTALYDETSPFLFGVLLRLLRDREQATEAPQDCYIRIWRRGATYRAERGPAAAWLIGIARYRAIDVVRSRLAHAAHLEHHASDLRDAAVPPTSPEADALLMTDLDRLSGCLERLPEDQRQCLLMSFLEGYSHHELSERLGLPLGTVKARIRRGLARLRQCLEAKTWITGNRS